MNTYLERQIAEFAVELLAIPLQDRDMTMVQWAMEAHSQEPKVRVLAHIGYWLRTLRGN